MTDHCMRKPPDCLPSSVEFVDSVFQAWTIAAQTCGVFERDFVIGGHIVRLRFAGTSIISTVIPALAHLAIAPAVQTPDLTIHLWDTHSSGVNMPFLPLWNDCSERGSVRAFAQSSLSVTRLPAAGVFSLWDPARQLAIYWAPGATEIPSYERGAPFRGLLNAWWREHDGLLLHAGAVGNENGGALLVGKGGVGKSTTALACMQASMQYLSDDYCLLTHKSDSIVHSLYCTAKLHSTDVQRFPALLPLISNPEELGEEKALCFLRQESTCRLARKIPLQAILLPRISGRTESRFIPASPFSALQALAPSALMQLPDAGAQEFSHIREVVTRVPCYWLEVGTDLQQIPQAVMEGIAHD